MKLTKILATIGPASNSPEVIEQLIEAGVDVFRLNFSHGAQEEHKKVFNNIRSISKKLNRHIGILQDLTGPKIRVGEVENNALPLKDGDTLILSTNPNDKGKDQRVFISYPGLYNEVKKDEIIYLSDGIIKIKITDIQNEDIVTTVLHGGILQSKKGVNLPMAQLSISCITEKDKGDLSFGMELGVDMVALSFVRHPDDIHELRELMKGHGRVAPIIAKIERPEALEHIDQIMDVTDGVMIARGDLAIETPMEKVPTIQKQIIAKAQKCHKPVIVATQMLETMIKEELPTRAEVTDVANAVFDGADAVMLSGETAVGDHPVTVVRQMSKILLETEKSAYSTLGPNKYRDPAEIQYAVAFSAASMAEDLDAKTIITPTVSGMTAILISRHRLNIPILALSPNKETLQKMSLLFGVYSVEAETMSDLDQVIAKSIKFAKGMNFAKKGDHIIITAGYPLHGKGNTNMIKALKLRLDD